MLKAPMKVMMKTALMRLRWMRRRTVELRSPRQAVRWSAWCGAGGRNKPSWRHSGSTCRARACSYEIRSPRTPSPRGEAVLHEPRDVRPHPRISSPGDCHSLPHGVAAGVVCFRRAASPFGPDHHSACWCGRARGRNSDPSRSSTRPHSDSTAPAPSTNCS